MKDWKYLIDDRTMAPVICYGDKCIKFTRESLENSTNKEKYYKSFFLKELRSEKIKKIFYE